MWFDDPTEVVAFAKWLFDGSTETWRAAVDVFDKPEQWTAEYDWYLAEKGMSHVD